MPTESISVPQPNEKHERKCTQSVNIICRPPFALPFFAQSLIKLTIATTTIIVVDGPPDEVSLSVFLVGVGAAEVVCPLVAAELLITVEATMAVVGAVVVVVVVAPVLLGLGKIVTVPQDTGPQGNGKRVTYVPA